MTTPTADGPGALRLLRVCGGAILLIFVVGSVVGPTAPVTVNVLGFLTPVVGMELVSDPNEVFGILGRPDSFERPAAVAAMRRATWLDFLFLAVYSAFHVGIGRLLVARGRMGRGVAAAFFALAVAVGVADVLENLQILNLTGTMDAGAMEPALGRLRLFTVIKWYTLYAVSGMIAIFVWRERDWWRWSAPFYGLVTVCGSVALAHLPAIEWSMLPLAVAWTMTWIYALRS